MNAALHGSSERSNENGKANGDVLRVLRTVQLKCQSKYTHCHVKGHQADIKKLQKLKFEAKLNYYCHRWAKDAIKEFIFEKTESVVEIRRAAQTVNST